MRKGGDNKEKKEKPKILQIKNLKTREREVKLKKVRKLSFWGILGVLTVVLFLTGISLMQAQVKIQKKPIPPPEAIWSVSIPTGADTTLLGDGQEYIDGENSIEVTVEKESPGAYRRDNDFVTSIFFKIANPTNPYRYVEFNGVNLTKLFEGDYDWIEPDYGCLCCVFPGQDGQDICDNCSINCMEGFLNDAFHPYTTDADSTYRYFIIELLAYDKDILTMEIGESYQLGQYGHYHDYFSMRLIYQTQDREPTYHNIDCCKSAHGGEGSIHPFNIWITRTGENRWTLDIGKSGDPQILFLEEYYYDAIKRGKHYKLTGWYSTLFAKGEFLFSFDLRRTEPSS